MQDNFQYSEDVHLQGKMHPNPNYIFYKLWFQGVSRAREKLCILVIGNEELFKKLLSVKNKFKQYETTVLIKLDIKNIKYI